MQEILLIVIDKWPRSMIPKMDNAISTSNLTKAYGNFKAVDSLNIEVNSGEIFGFLGPNGSGKTTTIRMLCGLLSPTSGSAEVGSLNILKDSLEIKRIIGLLPESSGFYNWMNAEEYLLHFAALNKIEHQESKTRVQNILETVGLAEKSFAPIGFYSRGMKQRLGLARALINQPKILFLDEPTLGLDPRGQEDIKKILLTLKKEGVTIFLSSHALSEVSSLCTRIAIMSHGKLLAEGTMSELRELAGDTGSVLVRVMNFKDSQKALSIFPFHTEANHSDTFLDVIIPDSSGTTAHLIDVFEDAGFEIHEIHRVEMSLEQVFFRLTEPRKVENKAGEGNSV
jgi:ABC-2 type transport system ATP-binding protein